MLMDPMLTVALSSWAACSAPLPAVLFRRVKTSLPLIFGLCSVGLGINLVIKVTFMPAVVLAMIIGTAIGEILYVERGIGKVAGSTRSVINAFTAGEGINL